jgi:hypothetical protein
MSTQEEVLEAKQWLSKVYLAANIITGQTILTTYRPGNRCGPQIYPHFPTSSLRMQNYPLSHHPNKPLGKASQK